MAKYLQMIGYENFSALAEKNAALLEKISFDPANDDPFALDTPQTLRATGLFTEAAIDAMFNSTGKEIDSAPPTEPIPPGVGMLLVRPDMTHIAPQVERFIGDRFQLLDVTSTQVTPETYWAMYGDAIVGKEARQSRLTRAAIYIGSPCKLFVFERTETKADEIPAADYVFQNLKGRQGVRQTGTLRGELVYNAAVDAGFHRLSDPEAALVADPFGAYRKIVRQKVPSPCHTLTHPLLFFTGVGIHIPNYQEMQRDLTLLTTEHE